MSNREVVSGHWEIVSGRTGKCRTASFGIQHQAIVIYMPPEAALRFPVVLVRHFPVARAERLLPVGAKTSLCH